MLPYKDAVLCLYLLFVWRNRKCVCASDFYKDMATANLLAILSIIVTVFNCVSTQWEMYSDVGKSCISHLHSEGKCTFRSKCPYEKDARIFFVPVNFIRCNAVSIETVVCCPKEKFWPMPSKIPNRFEEGRPAVEQPQRSKAEKACQKYREDEYRLVHENMLKGFDAEEKEFPHMVALGYIEEDNAYYTWHCGGSLISENFVLTAAHCIITENGLNPVAVRLGDIYLYSSEEDNKQNYTVHRYWIHPEYKHGLIYDDIGLVQLAENVKFSLEVQPACIATPEFTDRVGSMWWNEVLIATGWGSMLPENYAPSEQLLKINLTVVPFENCQEYFWSDPGSPHKLIPQGIIENMLCAIDPQENMATCKGDSGGPLQIREDPDSPIYTVVGVTSFGPTPCGGPTPTVFTKVSHHVEWITGIVWH